MSDQAEQRRSVAPASLSELASILEELWIHEDGGNHQKQLDLSPPFSALHMYRAGLVLYRLQETGPQVEYRRLMTCIQDLMKTLPTAYLRNVLLSELNAAFSTVLSTKSSLDEDALFDATRSMCGIYANNKIACINGFTVELCSTLSIAFDHLKRQISNRDDVLCTNLCRALSSLLVEGLLAMYGTQENEEQTIEVIMETTRVLTLDQQNTFLGDTLDFQQRTDPVRTYLPAKLTSRLEPSPQRDYLILMLNSATRSSDVKPTSTKPNDSTGAAPAASKRSTPQSVIQRRIQQVRDVLPDLGEGYVEAALSCFQGDVERTVGALLEGQHDLGSLPVILQTMDRALPARRTETTPDSYTQDDDEARQLTKQRAADMERQEEVEAYALRVMTAHQSEYDDDYDDQYDGMDGGDLGGGDGETYDVDLDTIRTYNRVARAAESEDVFWEQNHNINRPQSSGNRQSANGDDASIKEYRGSDKGKGGRIVGPDGKYLPIQKGGKKGRQQRAKQHADEKQEGNKETQGDAAMTKIQKRRKNDNKAKVGNHHRKERAQKKKASGM